VALTNGCPNGSNVVFVLSQDKWLSMESALGLNVVVVLPTG